jgi:hypothetical protein
LVELQFCKLIVVGSSPTGGFFSDRNAFDLL